MGIRGQNVVGGIQARKHRNIVSKSDPGLNLTLLNSGPQVPHLQEGENLNPEPQAET